MALPTYSIRAIADGGTMMDRGILPAFLKLKMTMLYDGPANLEFDYAIGGENADLLVSQQELAVWDENGEIADARFIIQNINGNVVSADGVRIKGFKAQNLYSVLQTAINQPPVYPAAKSKYDGKVYKLRSPGYIMQDLIALSQARGEMQGVTEDFSATLTSAGNAWTDSDIDVTIPWGWTLAQVLDWLTDRGEIDWRMRGRVLQMYNQGTLGTDRTVNNDVIIWAGDSVKEIPEETDSSELFTAVLVKGKDGLAVLVKDDAAIAVYKRRVGVYTDDGIEKVTNATKKGTKWLNARRNPRTVRTVSYALSSSGPIPFRNYDCGDLIWVDRGGVLGREVVQQIVVETSGSDGQGTCTLTLGGRFKGKFAKVIQGQQASSGGGSVTSGGSPPALPPRRTGLAPGQVAQPVVTSNTVYFNALGAPFSRVELGWPILVADEDGGVMTDFDHYEVYWKYNVDSVYQEPIITTQTSVVIEGLRPGRAATAYVLGVNYAGVRGAASLTVGWTPLVDTTPPPTPSTPTVSTKLGVIRASWNGLDNVGGAMPADFRFAEIHFGTTAGFTPDSTTRQGELQGPGAVLFQNPVIGTQYFAKVKVYDTTGLSAVSAASAGVTATQVTGLDMLSGSIGYDALGFKDMNNLVADGSFENTGMDAQRTMAAAWSIITSTVADAFLGTRYARVNGATNPSTIRDLLLTGTMDVRFGDQIWVRVAYRRAVGSNGTFKVVATETDSAGAVTTPTVLTLTTVSGAWVEVSGYYTPGSTIEKVKFSVQLAADSTTGIQEVDAVEIRQVQGTALIMDAAIARAKIQLLAVDDARINNLHGGKVDAQTLSAEELNIGVLGKNLAANPSFEENWGWVFNNLTGTVSYDSTPGRANSGIRVLKLSVPNAASACNAVTDPLFLQPVKPSTDYRVIANVAASIAVTTDGFSVRPRWYDAAGAFISEPTTNVDTENQGLGVDFVEIAGTYTSPATAAFAGLGLYYSLPDAGASDAYVDDVALIEIGVGASQLTSAGLKVWDTNGSLLIDLSSKLVGNVLNIQKGGVSVASISNDGAISGSSVTTDELTIAGETYAELDWERPWGLVAYGARTGQSAFSGAEAAFLEVQGDLVVGRLYKIRTNSMWVANATFETDLLIRYTKGATPGAAATQPGTASTLLAQARAGGSLTNTTTFIEMPLALAGTLGDIYEYRFVLTYKPAGGGTSAVGTTLHPLYISIEDMGPDRGDVGIDRSGAVVTKKDYTKTYNCDGSATYDSSGNSIGGSTVNQGYYSGTNGNQRGLISFPTQVLTDLTGATVKKIEVYLYFNHWYNNSGGTAVIGTHQYTAPLPSSMSLGGNTFEDLIRSSGWPKPGGRWVTLPSSTWADFKSGVAHGIIIGPGPSNSSLYYGKADGNTMAHEPRLRVTYNK